MSYILDALRRADAERQLGRPPDLHAQPLPAAMLDERARPARRPLAWLVAGLAMAAAAVLAAWLVPPWWRVPAPAPSAPPVPPVATLPAPPPVATPTVEPARPGSPATRADDIVSPGAALPATSASALSALPPLPPPTPPTPQRAAAPVEPPPRMTTASPAATPSPVPAAPAPAVTTPASVTPAPSLRERPDLQRELPPIVFGGSVYSEQASARIVVLNGRVFREGETIMPDLVVDEIRPRGAVLRWREQRFSLP